MLNKHYNVFSLFMVELLSYLFRLDGALTVILLNFGYHKVITWHMVNGKFKIFLGNNTTPTDTIYIHSIHTMVTIVIWTLFYYCLSMFEFAFLLIHCEIMWYLLFSMDVCACCIFVVIVASISNRLLYEVYNEWSCLESNMATITRI